MTQPPSATPHPRLYLLAVGGGFAGLLLWFAIGRSLGVLEWIGALFPPSHAGAGLMVAIMVLMAPAFWLWNRYNRWVEKRLGVSGRYYEENLYRPPRQK
ncbi:MAG: hypothetical protein SVU24_03505 [Pseudomonadota bacterium]|jgi:hypothetical protein|nr:hypothetical protein [Pseudomonadota bacterium]